MKNYLQDQPVDIANSIVLLMSFIMSFNSLLPNNNNSIENINTNGAIIESIDLTDEALEPILFSDVTDIFQRIFAVTSVYIQILNVNSYFNGGNYETNVNNKFNNLPHLKKSLERLKNFISNSEIKDIKDIEDLEKKLANFASKYNLNFDNIMKNKDYNAISKDLYKYKYNYKNNQKEKESLKILRNILVDTNK